MFSKLSFFQVTFGLVLILQGNSARAESKIFDIIDPSKYYMAASSDERGYKHATENEEFRNSIHNLIFLRAQQFCQAHGFLGLADYPAYNTIEEPKDTMTTAYLPYFEEQTSNYSLAWSEFKAQRPWQFANNGHHSMKTRLTTPALAVGTYGATLAATTLIAGTAGLGAIALVPLGACAAFGILVAPNVHHKITYEHAQSRAAQGKIVNHKRKSKLFFKKKSVVPHLVFTYLGCSSDVPTVQTFWQDLAQIRPEILVSPLDGVE